MLRLTDPTSGTIRLNGEDVTHMAGEGLRRARRNVQLVFQDPFASLNPRYDRAPDLSPEPLINYGAVNDRGVRPPDRNALFDCGRAGAASMGPLSARILRRPGASGSRSRGRWRSIQRVLILDESGRGARRLDPGADPQPARRPQRAGVSYLLISHDLSVVEFISTTVAVMYLGTIVEIASRDAFFKNPRHPYARALLDSVRVTHPSRRGRRALLQGEIPSASALPSGCRFRTRCPMATAICAERPPPLEEKASGHRVACHHVERQTSTPAYQ